MNEFLKFGGGEGHLNVWVWGVSKSIKFKQHGYFRRAL